MYLDENRIEVGSLGPAPRLPDGRYRKLMKDLRSWDEVLRFMHCLSPCAGLMDDVFP